VSALLDRLAELERAVERFGDAVAERQALAEQLEQERRS